MKTEQINSELDSMTVAAYVNLCIQQSDMKSYEIKWLHSPLSYSKLAKIHEPNSLVESSRILVLFDFFILYLLVINNLFI